MADDKARAKSPGEFTRDMPEGRSAGPEADDDEMDHRFAADEEVKDDPAGAEEARTPGQGS